MTLQASQAVAGVDANVLDALWDQTAPYVFIDRDEWERRLAGWDIEPVHVDGRLAFALLRQGPEFHYATFGVAPLSLALLRRWLTPQLEQFGYVTSRTPLEDLRQQRMNKRLGAVVTDSDEMFVHFRLDK